MKKESLVLILVLFFLVTCKEEEIFISVTDVTLDSSSVELVEGETANLSATVSPNDAYNKKVLWVSSNTSVVTVSNGVITAISEGNAIITAKSDDGGKTATCSVTVKKKVINVTGVSLDKETINLSIGEDYNFNATIEPSNATNKNLTWSSSDESVAIVTSEGQVKAIAVGATAIKVATEDGDFSASSQVVVTISVSGISLSSKEITLGEGESKTVLATITPSDATNKNVIWESSDPTVAIVDNGEITAISAGTTVVTATSEDGSSTESCVVTVVAYVSEVTLNKSEITLSVGTSEVLIATIHPSNATNKNLKWVSSDAAIVNVVEGTITALSDGTAIITVISEDGEKSATCTVTVVVPVSSISINKSELTLKVGDVEELIATILPSDATNKNVTWSSSNSSVVSVNKGVVSAIQIGSARITVETEDGEMSVSCDITVVVPVTGVSLNKTSIVMEDGASEVITAMIAPSNASNKKVNWSSSDISVVNVTNGIVTSVNPGHAIVTAITEDGSYEATCNVEVKSSSLPSKWDGVSYDLSWYDRGVNGVYHIKTAAELAGLSRCFSQGYYSHGDFSGKTIYLNRDIDLGGYEWTPIGTVINNTYYNFAGTFDGNNHEIKGLNISKFNNSTGIQVAGLFGVAFTDGFSVKNLTVEGEIVVTAPSNTIGATSVGGIVGLMQSNASIENCHTNVNIYSDAPTGNNIGVYTGGIVGNMNIFTSSNDEPLKKCSSSGRISVTLNSSNTARIGGIVGQLNVKEGVISHSSSSSWITVSGGDNVYVGGIVGTSQSRGVVNTLFSGSASVNTPRFGTIGGIIGMNFSTELISNSVVTGNYTRSGSNIYMSAIIGFGGDDVSVVNTYYKSGLSSSYGTAISEDILMDGSVLPGLDTSIWSFPTGSYPRLLFN